MTRICSPGGDGKGQESTKQPFTVFEDILWSFSDAHVSLTEAIHFKTSLCVRHQAQLCDKVQHGALTMSSW